MVYPPKSVIPTTVWCPHIQTANRHESMFNKGTIYDILWQMWKNYDGLRYAAIMGHFRVHLSLHFKARLSAKSLLWKSVFIHIEIGTNYHNKRFALRLALKERLRGTRKWPIVLAFWVQWSISVFDYAVNNPQERRASPRVPQIKNKRRHCGFHANVSLSFARAWSFLEVSKIISFLYLLIG